MKPLNFRPNLSEILMYNVVGNSRAFLLSSNLQWNTEVHKTRTQICICGTVLMVAVSASLTNDINWGQSCHISISNHTPIHYHWGEFFPHYCANIIYFQLEIKQNGNLQGRFFFLYQYSTLPLKTSLPFATNNFARGSFDAISNLQT